MAIAFFVSSIGDTDLAKASIAKLLEKRDFEQTLISTSLYDSNGCGLSGYPNSAKP
jgi:hypothetical protein